MNFRFQIIQESSEPTIYKALTMDQLQKLYPEVNWLEYLFGVFPDLVLDVNVEVILDAPNFFRSFFKLLSKTSSRTLANYIIWRTAMESGLYLNPIIRALSMKFNTLLGQGDRLWWQYCIKLAQQNLHLASGALYANKVFSEFNKYYATDIFYNIRDSFRNSSEKVR